MLVRRAKEACWNRKFEILKSMEQCHTKEAREALIQEFRRMNMVLMELEKIEKRTQEVEI